jgi:hypothetical protein
VRNKHENVDAATQRERCPPAGELAVSVKAIHSADTQASCVLPCIIKQNVPAVVGSSRHRVSVEKVSESLSGSGFLVTLTNDARHPAARASTGKW